MESSDRQANALYRIVADPTGGRFEVEATHAFVDAAGAPPGFDIALVARAIARRVRGTSWQIVVRDAGSSRAIAHTQHVAPKDEALSMVAHLSQAIESGKFSGTDYQ